MDTQPTAAATHSLLATQPVAGASRADLSELIFSFELPEVFFELARHSVGVNAGGVYGSLPRQWLLRQARSSGVNIILSLVESPLVYCSSLRWDE